MLPILSATSTPTVRIPTDIIIAPVKTDLPETGKLATVSSRFVRNTSSHFERPPTISVSAATKTARCNELINTGQCYGTVSRLS